MAVCVETEDGNFGRMDPPLRLVVAPGLGLGGKDCRVSNLKRRQNAGVLEDGSDTRGRGIDDFESPGVTPPEGTPWTHFDVVLVAKCGKLREERVGGCREHGWNLYHRGFPGVSKKRVGSAASDGVKDPRQSVPEHNHRATMTRLNRPETSPSTRDRANTKSDLSRPMSVKQHLSVVDREPRVASAVEDDDRRDRYRLERSTGDRPTGFAVVQEKEVVRPTLRTLERQIVAVPSRPELDECHASAGFGIR